MRDWVLEILTASGESPDAWRFHTDVPLAQWTTFKVGGNADLLVIPQSVAQLITLLQRADAMRIPVCVIGGGSNLIVRDGGLPGLVIAIRDDPGIITEDDAWCIHTGAGTRLTQLAYFALEHGLSGLEYAVGIPGTLGGAIYMNAGAFGAVTGNLIVSVEILDETLRCRTLTATELAFSYRCSTFQRRPAEAPWWIVSACLQLTLDDPALIKQRMTENTRIRNSRQPVQYASAGSIFRRSGDLIPAKMIEEAGLKGLEYGGAQVSTQHAGFIINTGRATASDILILIDMVREAILQRYGTELELEVRILGVE